MERCHNQHHFVSRVNPQVVQIPLGIVGFQDVIDFDEKVLLERFESTAREKSSWFCWKLKAHFWVLKKVLVWSFNFL